jgi:hypothetical protein
MATRRDNNLADRTYFRAARKLRARVDTQREFLFSGYEDWLCNILDGREESCTFSDTLELCIHVALCTGVAIGQKYPKLTKARAYRRSLRRVQRRAT